MHVGQSVRILVGIAHQKIDQTPENRSYNRFGIFLVVRKSIRELYLQKIVSKIVATFIYLVVEVPEQYQSKRLG